MFYLYTIEPSLNNVHFIFTFQSLCPLFLAFLHWLALLIKCWGGNEVWNQKVLNLNWDFYRNPLSHQQSFLGALRVEAPNGWGGSKIGNICFIYINSITVPIQKFFFAEFLCSQYDPLSLCLHDSQLAHLPPGTLRGPNPWDLSLGLLSQVWMVNSDSSVLSSLFLMRPGNCPHRFPHSCEECPLLWRGSHMEGPHIFTKDS